MYSVAAGTNATCGIYEMSNLTEKNGHEFRHVIVRFNHNHVVCLG